MRCYSAPAVLYHPHVVATVQGIVESVQVGTWGLQSQSGALTALTNQFGKPTRTREQKKAANSRFAAQFAEWDLADFSVKDHEKRQPAR